MVLLIIFIRVFVRIELSEDFFLGVSRVTLVAQYSMSIVAYVQRNTVLIVLYFIRSFFRWFQILILFAKVALRLPKRSIQYYYCIVLYCIVLYCIVLYCR